MQDDMDSTIERLAHLAGTTFYGKYRATVVDVNDPNDQCRIRATVPAVLGDTPCGWAMPAMPFAGDGHGFVMLPEIGSGVWIEFEGGHLDFPIWSGGWWAKDQRPDPKGPGKRVIVSKTGHTILLDDDDGEVKITHANGPEIRMTGDEMTLTVGGSVISITTGSISLNNGVVKVGSAGVSLVNGAMVFGTPPT